ncbi:MAG: hypothetical protein ACI97A_003510 [Planctomycetota bacterium]
MALASKAAVLVIKASSLPGLELMRFVGFREPLEGPNSFFKCFYNPGLNGYIQAPPKTVAMRNYPCR